LACVLIAVLLASISPVAAAEKITLVRADKSERTLELIAGDRTVRTYYFALGANPVGHKRQQGDERTPEGRDVLDWRNPDSIAFRSIHISYPNQADRAAASTRGVDPGGDIMIHGQPNGWGWWSWALQWVDWTDGCIGVTDRDMAEIWDMVQDGTPIEITP
jgi:murein L,D-transpeptidase YafK